MYTIPSLRRLLIIRAVMNLVLSRISRPTAVVHSYHKRDLPPQHTGLFKLFKAKNIFTSLILHLLALRCVFRVLTQVSWIIMTESVNYMPSISGVSWAWQFFTKNKTSYNVQCKKCPKIIKCNGWSTSGLIFGI